LTRMYMLCSQARCWDRSRYNGPGVLRSESLSCAGYLSGRSVDITRARVGR